MTAYLLKAANDRYLERIPYDGSWSWQAPCLQHATPMTKSLAATFLSFYLAKGERCAVVVDPLERTAVDEPETPHAERAEHATREASLAVDALNDLQFEGRR